jgi:hypothetical protein
MNDANKVTLRAAEAHVRVIRTMDRHQDGVRPCDLGVVEVATLAHLPERKTRRALAGALVGPCSRRNSIANAVLAIREREH